MRGLSAHGTNCMRKGIENAGRLVLAGGLIYIFYRGRARESGVGQMGGGNRSIDNLH